MSITRTVSETMLRSNFTSLQSNTAAHNSNLGIVFTFILLKKEKKLRLLRRSTFDLAIISFH